MGASFEEQQAESMRRYSARLQLDAALRYLARDATEAAPRKLGNVAFWIDPRDGLCFDVPSDRWDWDALVADLGSIATEGE